MKHALFLLFILLFASCGDSHIENDSLTRNEGVTGECKLHFQTEDLCLEMEWELMPTDSETGSMILTFNKDPIYEPFVVLWMPSMGHGSSPVSVEEIEPGKYRVKDVFFIMPGPWDIRYQLRNHNTIVEEIIQKINI